MRTAALTLRAVPRLALALPPRVRMLTAIALIATSVTAVLYYAWFRDSTLVKVRDVSVVGLTGPDAARVRERLKEAGLDMTTLHVDQQHLRQAVAAEPSIASLRATADFPHGLQIDVTENHPVAAVTIPGSGRVPIAGNGTLMPGNRDSRTVPELKIQGIAKVGRDGIAAARLEDPRIEPLVLIAATAPPALLRRATSVERRKGEGLVVVLRNGPRIVFGGGSSVAQKWRAAAGVLASPDARGAAYVDVRMPGRPVAGGLKAQIPAGGTAPATTPAPPQPSPQPAPSAPSTPAGGSPQTVAPAAPATPAPAQPQPGPAAPQTPSANTQP
jgi:cell division protein FtsQ